MATIVYPFTLTAGQPENVNQLNSNLNAITAQVNGNLDGTNISAGYVEPAFANYKPLGIERARELVPAMVSGTYPLGAQAPYWLAAFYFDPAEHVAGARTAKCRVRAMLAVGDVAATGVTFNIGLMTATVSGTGGTGHEPVIVNGTGQGSAPFGPAPTVSTPFTAVSGDFTLVAGNYAMYVFNTATLPANCYVSCYARLEMRQT